MQAMSLSRLCSRFQVVWLYVLLCLLAQLVSGFELETPPRLIITHTPTSIGYKIKADTDQTRWIMNITDLDGRNPETLNDGEVFEASSAQGNVEVTIEHEGLFLLKAVNPDSISQVYATSLPAIVVDTPPSGGSNSGSGSGTGGGDETGSDDGDDPNNSGDDGDDGDNGDDGDSSGDNGENSGDDGDDGHSSGDDGDSTGDGHASATPPPESESTPGSVKPTISPGSPASANSKNGNGNTAVIAGCVTAGIIVLILILAALVFFRRSQKKPARPLTFYRDRMIRPPTPPQEPVAVQVPPSILKNPNNSYTGPSSGTSGLGAGAGAFGMHQAPLTYPYTMPHSATATGVDIGGAASPGRREFILRSPRPLPSAPGGGHGGLKEFILKSPMRDSFAGYSKP